MTVTGVRGPAGQTARGPVMEELAFALDFVIARLRSMEEKLAKEKGSWKNHAMRSLVLVSMTYTSCYYRVLLLSRACKGGLISILDRQFVPFCLSFCAFQSAPYSNSRLSCLIGDVQAFYDM